MNTKHLPKTFQGAGETKGFTYTRNQTSKHAYLYAVAIEDKHTHYEVIVRKTVPLCIDFATKQYSNTDFKEIYPKGKDFGKLGWSFRDYDKALVKFMEVSK